MNLLRRFQSLVPAPAPLLVGEVLSHNLDGTSTLQAPDGAVYRARGQQVLVGAMAWVRGGAVEGEAPALPAHEVDV